MEKFKLKNEANIYDYSDNIMFEFGSKLTASYLNHDEFVELVKRFLLKLPPGRKININSFKINSNIYKKFWNILKKISIDLDIEITINEQHTIFYKNIIL